METTAPDPNAEAQTALSPWQIFWRRLKRRRIAMIGGAILIFLYLVALFAGFVAPYRYDNLDTDYSFHPPLWPRLHGFHLVVPRYEPGNGILFIAPFQTTRSRSIFSFAATNTNCSA